MGLEVQAQGELAGTVAAVFGGLNGLDGAEGRRRDVGWRWREVRMIKKIGESTFEAKLDALRDMKCLCKAGGDCGCARAFKNSDSAIPYWAGRNRIERGEIEHAAGCRVGDVWIADAVGTLQRAAVRKIEIAGIVA